MRYRARWCLALSLSVCLLALGVGVRKADAHPLHTTLVQLVYDERGHALEGSIRVFAGDFAAAVAKRRGVPTPDDDRVSDAEALAYVSSTFHVTDAAGRAVPLAWCGSRRSGDVLWLCVRASNVAPPGELELSDQMLCELFDDQINIVQSAAGAKHSSMLFTKGDEAKSAM
jgi:hypothetical protein